MEENVLNKVTNLGGLFAQKSGHPLADARELRKVLAELPQDNAFKSLDEITGWLESLAGVADFPVDRLYAVLQQFEETAAPHLKRLSQEYFHTARLSKSEEKRLWSINYGFWTLLAEAYERCLKAISDRAGSGELPKSTLPMLAARLIVALGNILKWEQFHYGPLHGELWRRLGAALLAAEAGQQGGKAVAMLGRGGMSSPLQEYQKVMLFQAASLDSLLPVEIEVAERLIAHYLPGFVYTEKALEDSVYWVDLALPQAPLRQARMPARAQATQRFIKPGPAHAEMLAMLDSLERGGDVPAEISLGAAYPAKLLIRVMRHLTAYLAPVTPQRQHDRHRVKHRMSVLHGLVNAFVVFSGEFGGRPAGLQMESWVVENVSRGGFGALLGSVPGEWLRVGALIAMQPEGGDNWLVGVIRRCHRETESEARVGIQVLARQAVSAELRIRSASSYAAAAGVPALLLQDGNAADEMRVVLPPATFDQRESLEYAEGGRRVSLNPVALIEQTSDYEVGRYRRSVAG